MNYRLHWLEEVEDNLALIWERSPIRPAVVEASSDIDRRLTGLGPNAGKELSEGLYELGVPPLRVLYTVEGREVEVVAIGEIRLS